MGFDDMEVQGTAEKFGTVGRKPFKDAGRARAAADEGDGGYS